MTDRTILHVDMNAYFASVEQKSNPILRGRPVVVVADSRRRSVVLTASYEARAWGVRTGMNLGEARTLCPQAVAVDGNSDKYLDATAAIAEVLESFSDQVEMSSCDEAFLDATGSLGCFRTDGAGLGEMVRREIGRKTGLPCSVGVAPNKLLAKLASDKKKPDGLTVISPDSVEAALARTPVEDLCGVGDRFREKLNAMGIFTCKDLGGAGIGPLTHAFGFWAHRLKRMGQGKDDSPVGRPADVRDPKSMGHSTTFPRDTADPEILRSFLLLLSEKVALRLRRGGWEGRAVALTVRYDDFTTFSRHGRVREPLDDGCRIYGAALNILEGRDLRRPVRLLGVSVSDLTPNAWQEFLFESWSRRGKVNAAADRINEKFGKGTLRPAGVLRAERFGVLAPPIPPSHRHLMAERAVPARGPGHPQGLSGLKRKRIGEKVSGNGGGGRGDL